MKDRNTNMKKIQTIFVVLFCGCVLCTRARTAFVHRSTRFTQCTHLGLDIRQGPLSPDLLADVWGRGPILIRQGFDAQHLGATQVWPDWDTVLQMACEEDANARVIRHIPGDDSSFTLDIGPFHEHDLSKLENQHDAWTLVVNDVDRFYPQLAEWIDQEFSYIPRWRRDDGQMSLAPKGGGIGPHVDNYDVFLIQASGEREWMIGKDKLSVKEEMESMIKGIDVRIIKDWDNREYTRLVLKAGDVLYLPPRVAHCGIALSDACMTLSVGCRTPSASDLISRLAERLTDSMSPSSSRRFEDFDLLHKFSHQKQTGEITPDTKNQMKQLVWDAMNDFMEDESQWDLLLGGILTESTRLRESYPLSLADADPEWVTDVGIWADPKQAVASVVSGAGSFFRAEGVSFAYSKDDAVIRLFANGEHFEIRSTNPLTESVVISIINDGELTAENLSSDDTIVELLERLIAKGLLYGSG